MYPHCEALSASFTEIARRFNEFLRARRHNDDPLVLVVANHLRNLPISNTTC